MNKAISPSGADVTVIVPVHNRPRLLIRALTSIAKQTCRPKEVIIVDDASTDDTVKCATEWINSSSLRCRLIQLQRNGGPAKARNIGIEMVTTRYTAMLDSDDTYEPNALEMLVLSLEQSPGAVVSCAFAKMMGDDGSKTSIGFEKYFDLERHGDPFVVGGYQAFRLYDPKSLLLKATFVLPSAACFVTELARNLGGMPEALRYGEDWVLWLRLSQCGPFVVLPIEVSSHYFQADNLTSAANTLQNAEAKIRGLRGVLAGEWGISVTAEQRQILDQEIAKHRRTWRYAASKLGIRQYLKMLHRDSEGVLSVVRHIVHDPLSLVRSVYYSLASRRHKARFVSAT